MAKKFGKVLLFTALVGSAIAGGMALYNKYKGEKDDFDDDDFNSFNDDDDEDDDFFGHDSSSVNEDKGRDYVSIPRETEESIDDTDKTTDDTDEEKSEPEVKVNVTIDSSIPVEETDDDTTSAL